VKTSFSARASLLFAAGLFIAIFSSEVFRFGWEVVFKQAKHYSLWIPFLLIGFGAGNLYWGKKWIGWLIFSAAFICVTLIFTAMMMLSRKVPSRVWIHFSAALLMYCSLVVMGLLQLRKEMKG